MAIAIGVVDARHGEACLVVIEETLDFGDDALFTGSGEPDGTTISLAPR